MTYQTAIKSRIFTKIGKEPVVILPLKNWKIVEEQLEDFENALRFNNAFKESRSQKSISLSSLKKKYNLK